MKWTILGILLILSACAGTKNTPDASLSPTPVAESKLESPPAVEPKPAPKPENTAPVSCKDGQWCYDVLVLAKITPAMEKASPGDLCPNYNKVVMVPALSLSFVGTNASALAQSVGKNSELSSVAAAPLVNKAKFWLSLEKGIAYAESGWKVKPTPYLEDTLGIDKVTGLPVYSEGLFQLSYVDALTYRKEPTCALISYPKRNIHIPEINVGCAMEIQNRLLTNFPKLSVVDALGKYWSTIRKVVPKYNKSGKRIETGPEVTRRILKKEIPECYQ